MGRRHRYGPPCGPPEQGPHDEPPFHPGWHGWHAHHHAHHHHRRRGPWRRRPRGLQRRLFAWFGLAIVVTGATVFAMFNLFSAHGLRSVRRELARVERFAGGRFAAVWHDPAARDELAGSIARDLELGVRVRDANGALLSVATPSARACRRWHGIDVRAVEPYGGAGGPVLGRVDLCFDAFYGGGRPWHMPLALFVAGVVLWAMSGAVARRLTGPLSELTRVARKLGGGDLAARARLCGPYDGEVAELAAAMNEMAARIEKQLRDQRELLATVSHELRTPLTRIRLLLELARDGGGEAAPKPEPLDQIDGEVVEIDALVADLLASARMDFAALAPRELDAEKTARAALERAALPDAAVAVDGPAPGTLVADATLLTRSLGVLLDNARKYGGGRVTLRVRGGEETVAFEVDDQGPGFAPGDEARIFEPFYRGQRAEREEQPRGVGLGLALVKRIAEAHGGRAYASNLPGGGARVAIELPRVARDAASGARSSRPTPL